MPDTTPTVNDRRDDSTDVVAEVQYMGFKFSIYEKSNTSRLWFRGTVNGDRRRGSTGCSSLEAATEFVVATIEELAGRVITGDDLRTQTRTLQQVWSRFAVDQLPRYDRRQRRSNLRGSVRRLMDFWGEDKQVADIDAHDVRQFVEHRVEEDEVKISTAEKDIERICTVLNWAEERRIDGQPLLEENPIDLKWIPDETESPRQPVTGHERFLKLLPFTRTRGSTAHRGYFTTMWVLARHTGRRISSIRHLRYCDLMLSPEAIREKLEALLRAEILSEDVADLYLEQAPEIWEHGAVRWPPEYDKENLETGIVPLHPTARKALEHHLRRHPGRGQAFLFESKSSQADGRPVSNKTVGNWFNQAESNARGAGVDLRERKQDGWHALRRGWLSELPTHLGLKAAAKVAGWAWSDGLARLDDEKKGVSKLMHHRYLHALPLKEYRVATALPAARRNDDTARVTATSIEEMSGPEAKRRLAEILR